MTDTGPKDQPPRHLPVQAQHNHGDGTFVNGDVYGDIVQAVDAKTKALLAKVSEEAPALGHLLEQALEDGVITADTADALAYAARNINQDVADTIMVAARSINPDVADSIRMAAYSINEDVAGLLTRASSSINEDVAISLTRAGDSINEAVAATMTDAAMVMSKASAQLDVAALSRLVSRFEQSLGVGTHEGLEQQVQRLEATLESLQRLAQQLEGLQQGTTPLGRIAEISARLSRDADRIEATVTPPPPRILPDHRGRLYAFLWGSAAGAVALFSLVNR